MKYKFSHTSDDGKTYYWVGPRISGDSRSEHISCNVSWLWGTAGMEVAR